MGRGYATNHISSPTVHELKVLVDHSFEEPPVGTQESGVLANHIHDVTGYDGLVVFTALLLTETEQVFDHSDKEPLLVFLVHRTTER